MQLTALCRLIVYLVNASMFIKKKGVWHFYCEISQRIRYQTRNSLDIFFVIASSAYLALKLMSVADTAVAVVKFHI